MNVLLTVASSSVTGPAERLFGNARCLTAAGHEARVAFDTVRPGNLAERARAEGVALEEGLALSRKPTPRQIVHDLGRLRALLRERRADIVHSHFSHDHHLALISSAGLRGPLRIVRAAETEANLTPTVARRLAYRRTDGLEVATRGRARALVEGLGVDPLRVGVLPGAVDPVHFSPTVHGRPSELRRRLGIAADVLLVGIVARLKPERRHAELVEAVASLRGGFPRLRLAIVGRGEGEQALRVQVERLGLQREVLFAGYWAGDDLVEAYRGLDIAVWLADGNDGSARGLLEAMACGLPVVAGAAGAASEIVREERTGCLVPPGDVPGLARALARLAGSAADRRAFGEAARQRVMARFTWAQRGPALLEFYRHVQELPAAA
ncbi:MAG TPA: glycosyltransferase [Myxococcales bacterium]|nr:glycosyltransferase [Myxococcales bacterium]